jgi:hypothetical protein
MYDSHTTLFMNKSSVLNLSTKCGHFGILLRIPFTAFENIKEEISQRLSTVQRAKRTEVGNQRILLEDMETNIWTHCYSITEKLEILLFRHIQYIYFF